MLRISRDQMNDKYTSLHSLIVGRQQFESEHPFPPYSVYLTDINFSDLEQNSLLHYAAMMGDLEKIKYCIENRANMI